MTNKPEEKISRFFDAHATQWMKHYQGTGLALRLFNSLFRRGLKHRWEITMKYALPATGRTFLDVGCGAGDYSLALAEAGAAQVTGIDVAPAMIGLAQRRAAEQNLDASCRFLIKSFLNPRFNDSFDVVLAIGVFDYIDDYQSFWQKMVEVSSGLVIASFPQHSILREPLRKLRYKHKDLPVYFYSPEQLTELARSSGLASFKLQPYAAGFALIGFAQ